MYDLRLMEWRQAPDITLRVKKITSKLRLSHIDSDRVICFRSLGSTSRASARIWSLPRIWQQALQVEPNYCLEVISEKFDKLTREEQDKVLVHELAHVPRTFSGALRPHRGRRGGSGVSRKEVDGLFKKLKV